MQWDNWLVVRLKLLLSEGIWMQRTVAKVATVRSNCVWHASASVRAASSVTHVHLDVNRMWDVPIIQQTADWIWLWAGWNLLVVECNYFPTWSILLHILLLSEYFVSSSKIKIYSILFILKKETFIPFKVPHIAIMTTTICLLVIGPYYCISCSYHSPLSLGVEFAIRDFAAEGPRPSTRSYFC